ncbi:MAG: HIT domain-containing protein [Anaerolineaceae bacterium]|nr:HIT domain-containing protein [Anaerolineaceae bacterium]
MNFSITRLRMRNGLLGLARTRLAGWLIREVFAHMSFAIPMKRLRETPSLIAFHHPSPSYPVHILLVPKRGYHSLLDVSLLDSDFLRDLFETAQVLVRELGLEQAGYRMLVNGGANQDVPILHFHLISGSPFVK